jgi:hypothetical protein
MPKQPIQDMGASVRSRLQNIARERGQPFELLLTRYVLKRPLYRLSTTKYRKRFVLKRRHADDDGIRRQRGLHNACIICLTAS